MSCTRCGSAVCDGRTVACMGCGTEQCHNNGLGKGSCSACYYGILPGWSGSDKPCGYKGCANRAAFHYVPGSVQNVCIACSIRPKIMAYGRASSRITPGRISLASLVAERKLSALTARGAVQPEEHFVRRTW